MIFELFQVFVSQKAKSQANDRLSKMLILKFRYLYTLNLFKQ